MKLRLRGNSIRLRLGQSEVRRLAQDERVAESTTFGPAQQLVCEIEAASDIPETTVSFEGSRLRVRVPREVVRRWASSEEVSIAAEQRVNDRGDVLSILIEKDFECLDTPASEPQDDAFPNPQRCG